MAACPRCGAPLVDPGTCRYCRAGTLWEGEASESTASRLRCPRCAEKPQLLELTHGPVVVDICLSCQGGWFDLGELESALRAHKESGATAEGALGKAQMEEIRYLRCPRCDGLMSRLNFARTSGVILDQCLAHGLWVDGGELRRLKAWVMVNGMPAVKQLVEDTPGAKRAAVELGMLQLEERKERRRSAGWVGVAEVVIETIGGALEWVSKH